MNTYLFIPILFNEYFNVLIVCNLHSINVYFLLKCVQIKKLAKNKPIRMFMRINYVLILYKIEYLIIAIYAIQTALHTAQQKQNALIVKQVFWISMYILLLTL